MSYASTIAAMDVDVNPPGSAGSALQNPASAAHASMQSDPMITQLKSLISQRQTQASNAAVLTRQQEADAVDNIASFGTDAVTPQQVQAYIQSKRAWEVDRTNEQNYQAYLAARGPVYQAGLPFASQSDIDDVNARAADIAAASQEVTAAADQAQDMSTYDSQVSSLVNGDPTAAAGSVEAMGIGGTAQAKLGSLTSDMAILSGGEAAVSHIARVDGTAPSNPANACLPTSLISRGLKALTDAGKHLMATMKTITDAIASVLGPIAQWGLDMLKSLAGALKSVFASIGNMIKGAMDTFKGWVQDGIDALSSALKIARNKAFMNFLSFDDPCMKEAMKEVININNVDQAALDKARATA